MPAAHCPRCDKHVLSVQTWKNPQKRWGKYNREYYYACPGCAKPVTPYYYASFNCIDWSLPGQRIGDRKKPLVENTMKRIRYGYEKYGKTPLVISRGYGHSNQMRARDMSEAMPTQAGDAKHALTSPFMIENFGTSKARGIDERLGCITADGNKYGLLQPFIIQTDHQKAGESYWTTPVDQVLKTQKTWQTAGLVSPFITLNYSPGYSKPLSDSLGSITTQDHHGLVSNERINAFLQYYYGGSDVFAGMNQAARTLTTVDCASLINVRTATSVEDCTYRMLVPHEVQSGMAFDPTYKVLGDWKEKVKQLGNAVTPPAMKQLVGRCLDTIK
jgi:DNA (cytosine-5)-methyltransferase 1